MKNEIVDVIVDWIDEHLEEGLNIEAVAAKIGLLQVEFTARLQRKERHYAGEFYPQPPPGSGRTVPG